MPGGVEVGFPVNKKMLQFYSDLKSKQGVVKHQISKANDCPGI